MALTITSSTYAGESAGKYISAALQASNTLRDGLITVMPNIKYRETIQKLSTTDLIQAAGCDFSASGDATLDEITIEPKMLSVMLEMCIDPFASSWEAESLGFSAHHTNLPKSFEDYFIAHVLEKVAGNIETMIWNGDDAQSDEFGGVLPALAADANTIDVTGTTVTAANVVEELGKIADAIPKEIYSKEGCYIAVSQNIYRAYKRALGGFQAIGFDGNNTDINIQYFDGIKVVLAEGLPDNKAVAYEKENIVFGTGLLNDTQEIKLKNMDDVDLSNNVRFKMRFTATTKVLIPAEVVLYSI